MAILIDKKGDQTYDLTGDDYAVLGRRGDDTYILGAHNYFIVELRGDDTFIAGGGENFIFAGRGNDTVDYSLGGAINVDLLNGTASGGYAENNTLISVENIIGSNDPNGRDVIFGNNKKNKLYGLAGDDILEGGAGADIIDGGEGWDYARYTRSSEGVNINLATGVHTGGDAEGDTLIDIEAITGSDHADTFTGDDGNNHFYGGKGDDTFFGGLGKDRFWSGEGADYIDGGADEDFAHYEQSSAAVFVDLENGVFSGGDAEGDTLVNIEHIKGSNLSDPSQRDYLYGDSGENELYGLAGNDFLEGGAGEDYLDGGDGWDYARYTRSDEGVNINLETGVNTGGHADGDTLVNIEAVTGSDYADTLVGDDDHNHFYAGAGDDWMVGGLGQDQFWGFDGADTLAFTDAAAAFERPDFFRDFDASEGDALDISAILIGYDALTDAISDFVSVTDNGTDTFVAVDADGGGDNYITVARLFGVSGLDATTMEADGNLITETTVV